MNQQRRSSHFVVLTQEYLGGIIAGIGLGLLVASGFRPSGLGSYSALFWILAFFCIGAGSLLARSGQRKRSHQEQFDATHKV
jgi:hypothetical protein